MKELNTALFTAGLLEACDRIVASEPMLTEIDLKIGDGDHGIGMQIGFSKLKQLLLTKPFDDLYTLVQASGIELVKTMGGASGVIFGSLFIGGLDAVRDRQTIDAQTLCHFFESASCSIKNRGKAKRGDKTMLDALCGAIDAMQAAQTDDVLAILRAAADGAKQGAQATEDMLPRFGRSKNFRDSARGYPDPGAVSTSIFFEGFYTGIYNQTIGGTNNGTL